MVQFPMTFSYQWPGHWADRFVWPAWCQRNGYLSSLFWYSLLLPAEGWPGRLVAYWYGLLM